MKKFDRWIEKRFYKLHPEEKIPYNRPRIQAEEVKPLKVVAMLMMDDAMWDVVPPLERKRMLAEKFVPYIIDNMETDVRHDGKMGMRWFEGSFQFLPKRKGSE